MRKIVITRTIDERSRINIPIEVLNASKLKKGDLVQFEISRTGSLIIRKANNDEEQ